MMKRSSLSVVLLVPLLAAAGWFFLRDTAALAEAPVPLTRYTVSIASVGELKLDPENADQGVKLETSFQGDAEIAWDEKASLLRVSWSPRLQFLVNGQHLVPQEDAFAEIPHHEMAMRFSAQGEPEAVYFKPLKKLPPEAFELVVNTGKMLLLQLAWKRASLEQSQGYDIWGRNTRVSTLEPLGQEQTLKAHVQTASLSPTASGMSGKGAFDILLDGHGELLMLSGHQDSEAGAGLQLARSRTEYRLQRAFVSSGKTLDFSIDDMIREVPWITVNAKALKAANLAARTQGWDLQRIVNEAAQLLQSGKTSARDLFEVAQKLEDLLWLNENLANEFAALALQLGPEHPLFDELIKALRAVGGATSQAALRHLLLELEENENAARRIVFALAFVSAPNPASQAAVEELASSASNPSLRQTAELALGQMAYQLRDSEPGRASDMVSQYQETLRQSRESSVELSPNETRKVWQALNVIGNSGQCDDWTTLESYARSTDEDLASRAIEAMRFCRDHRVATVWLELFQRSAKNRQRVLEALDMRAERQLYDADLFNGLLSWIREKSNARSKLAPLTLRALEKLSRLDAGARGSFQALRQQCHELGLCQELASL